MVKQSRGYLYTNLASSDLSFEHLDNPSGMCPINWY